MDDILFSMEDQEGEFYIDTLNGVVSCDEFEKGDSEKDPGGDENRYIALPDWDSSDGFRLMERFAAGFKNPLIRDELSAALNRGKGVFRAFKNILNQHPETEKLWFAFKDREMKREIVNWYNALREEWGLERIGFEPEETGDLILEDFRFREFQPRDLPAARELHALCEKESPPEETNPAGEAAGAEISGDIALTAESGSGEFAACLSAVYRNGNYYIKHLEVKPEYRGLGIGEALLTHFLENLENRKGNGNESPNAPPGKAVYLDLPAAAEGFSRVLAREKFKPCVTRYCLDLEHNAP